MIKTELINGVIVSSLTFKETNDMIQGFFADVTQKKDLILSFFSNTSKGLNFGTTNINDMTTLELLEVYQKFVEYNPMFKLLERYLETVLKTPLPMLIDFVNKYGK